MDILYYGDKYKEEIFGSYAKAHGLNYECDYALRFDLPAITQQVLLLQPKEVILDADCNLDSEKEFADWVLRVKESIRCEIIILAQGYKPDSKLLTQLLANGISKIVKSDVLGIAKEEYAAYHEGRSDIAEAEIDILKFSLNESAAEIMSGRVEKRKEKRQPITIGVVGSMRRIGTTTAALQLAKYFKVKGFKVAYLQHNSTNFVQQLMHDYKTEGDESLKKITLDGIDLFYDLSLIKQIMAKDYDYYIYDYGILTTQNVVSILERKEILLVSGVKGEELENTILALKQFLKNTNITYCFNFIHETLKRQVLDMMSAKSDKTIFLSYAPEMLILEPGNFETFSKAFRIDQEVEISEPAGKGKRGFWNRRKEK